MGYQTTAVAGGKLSCVALQFGNAGDDGDLSSIAKLTTKGVTPGGYETMETDAPCIMIYDGVGGYTYYYYISDAYDAGGAEVTAWATATGDEATTATKALGTGLWLRAPSSTSDTGTLTEAGWVNNAETSTIDINVGLTLAANPYPTPINFSKVTTAGLTPGGYETMETDAPCIMIYDGVGGYTYYYYISDAYDAGGTEVTAWATATGDAVTEDIATAGKAFWARSATAGTLTFSL